MKDSIKNRKKQLLALCLSAMMLSSVTALAACEDDSTDSSSSSSSSTTSTQKDDGLIKNADFEIVSGSNLITTSVSDWTSAKTSDANGSANTSTAASGIVDLNEDAWADLTTSKYVATTAEEAEAHWDEMTTKDKLAFYKQWKADNSGKTISTELKDFYESFNIDEGDTFDMAHFDTHDGEAAAWKAAKDDGATDEDLTEFDTKVLMIHNQYTETSTVGTGQQYTSSSTVTVQAGTSAKFSVWVKTASLQCTDSYGNTQEAVDKGAFISITNTVGSTTLDEYKVENINTEAMGVTDHNGWKQYTFLLKGSSYTDTTFKMVLGLGQGSSNYRAEYVNGFAFFDDIECEIIPNEDCDLSTADHVADFDSKGEEKIINAYQNPDYATLALNFYGAFGTTTQSPTEVLDAANITVEDTKGEVGLPGNKISYTSKKDETAGATPVAPWLGEGFDATNDVVGVQANGVKADANADSLISKVANKYFKDADKYKDSATLLLLSENGVAYTAESAKQFTVNKGEYFAISFLVKTSAMKGKKGAGVTLSVAGKDTKISFDSIDTTTATAVTVNDEDIYEGWQKYFFFVENDSSNDENVTLTFNLGVTEITSSLTKDSFIGGFAAFSNFETKAMSKEEYQSVKSGTNAKTLSITDEEDETATQAGFTTAAGTPSNAIENGLANLNDYKGVYFDNQLLTGNLDATDEQKKINDNANAGLISKEYFADYFDDTDKAWLTSIKSAGSSAEEVWKKVFGNDTSMPLFIYNNSEATTSYGYIGSSKTISANTYAAVSLRVKGTKDSNAYIRLVDTNADNYDNLTVYNQTLTIGRNLTYWYDADGDIYDGDQATSKLAFKLQSNGLYKASSKWSGYDSLGENKDAYFANLSAYAVDPVTKNLLVAKGGASHDYNEKWNNEGLDGIAFYEKDGKYYADSARTVEVLNLADTSLTKRFEAIKGDDVAKLEATVTLKDDEWTYVTFFIHTADVAKSYRLEIFSGNASGEAKADSYLVVDNVNLGTAQDNFTGLLADEAYTDAASIKEESVFSYFDAATYLRYDETLDENGYGNLYAENYSATTQTEGISYLLYNVGNEYSVFADYAYTEKAVTASEPDDGDDDSSSDSSSDETAASDVWLGVSSIAIAAVLLLALVSIVVRKAIAKARKNRTAQHSPKAKK